MVAVRAAAMVLITLSVSAGTQQEPPGPHEGRVQQSHTEVGDAEVLITESDRTPFAEHAGQRVSSPAETDGAAVTAAAPAATVTISAALLLNGGQALLMGQTARVRVSWQYAVLPTVDSAATAWPFINGSQ